MKEIYSRIGRLNISRELYENEIECMQLLFSQIIPLKIKWEYDRVIIDAYSEHFKKSKEMEANIYTLYFTKLNGKLIINWE
jgi:hypothetical protein